MWYLCVISIANVSDVIIDEHGYTYFQIYLSDDEYTIENRQHKVIQNREINHWKTGLALPYIQVNQTKDYYSLITDDGYWLNSDMNWRNVI